MQKLPPIKVSMLSYSNVVSPMLNVDDVLTHNCLHNNLWSADLNISNINDRRGLEVLNHAVLKTISSVIYTMCIPFYLFIYSFIFNIVTCFWLAEYFI